jgi:PHD/YefM family antitoxin component YafN of YafNO toxin-antitoxin module
VHTFRRYVLPVLVVLAGGGVLTLLILLVPRIVEARLSVPTLGLIIGCATSVVGILTWLARLQVLAVMRGEEGKLVIQSVKAQLTGEQLLPAMLRTDEGKSLVQAILDRYRAEIFQTIEADVRRLIEHALAAHRASVEALVADRTGPAAVIAALDDPEIRERLRVFLEDPETMARLAALLNEDAARDMIIRILGDGRAREAIADALAADEAREQLARFFDSETARRKVATILATPQVRNKVVDIVKRDARNAVLGIMGSADGRRKLKELIASPDGEHALTDFLTGLRGNSAVLQSLRFDGGSAITQLVLFVLFTTPALSDRLANYLGVKLPRKPRAEAARSAARHRREKTDEPLPPPKPQTEGTY